MIYIAFLRGINVGGKNIIKMANLRQSFIAMGFGRVQTYIQSGNVLFEATEAEQPLCRRIEQNLADTFKIPVTVVLRTFGELEQTVTNCPFSQEQISQAEAASQVESLYVALLERSPAAEDAEQLNPYQSNTDRCRIIGREVFLLFHHSIRDSKLADNLHKLNVQMTVRNWKTIGKIIELARSMAI
jgi:Uncharacterized protein conserved in bacteria